jgi:hypothetical protein
MSSRHFRFGKETLSAYITSGIGRGIFLGLSTTGTSGGFCAKRLMEHRILGGITEKTPLCPHCRGMLKDSCRCI